MLRRVKRTRLYQEVEAQLAALIRSGELRPGDRLPPERELARRMQVSRASVREALRVMEQRGLVVSRAGAGTFIPSGSAEALARSLTHLAVQDVLELRLLLEPAVAALAARRATPEDLARLEAVVQEQERQLQQGRPAVEADEAFHAALAEATHNRALLRLGAALEEVLAPSRDESLQTPQRAQLSLRSHRAILEAVAAGRPDEARRAMEEHIHSVDLALFGLPQEWSDVAPAGASSGGVWPGAQVEPGPGGRSGGERVMGTAVQAKAPAEQGSGGSAARAGTLDGADGARAPRHGAVHDGETG